MAASVRHALALAVLFASVWTGARAASWEQSGSFLFQNYGSKAYGLSPQNWAVVQDRRGILYFGNTEGLLEFDGNHWRAIRLPNNGPVRSLALDDDGHVLVGGQGEIGSLAAGADGSTRYVSVLDSIPEADRKFGGVWSILNTQDGVVFSSYERLILRPRSGPMKVLRADARLRRAFLMHGKVHLVKANAGLHRLEGDQLLPVPGGEALAKTDIRGTYTDPQGETVLATAKGLVRQTSKGFEEAAPGLAPYLKDNSLYSVLPLPGGEVALGTTRGGLLLLDGVGTVIRTLGRTDGLPGDYIAAIAPDLQGGIWLATDNGLARFNPRFSRFDETHGLKSGVVSLATWNQRLYAGTTSGLFRMREPESGRPPVFEPVQQLQERVFVLLSRSDGLWAGTQTGVYRWNDKELKKILAGEVVYDLTVSPRDADRLYASGRFGAAVLERVDKDWKTVASVPAGGEEFRSNGEDPAGNLWITTLTGAVRADLSQTPPKIARYALPDGLPEGWKNAYRAGGRFGIASEQGLRKFDSAAGRFVPDAGFGEAFAGGQAGTMLVRDDPQGNVWITGKGYHGLLLKKPNASGWLWKPMILLGAGLDELWSIQTDPDGVVWASGSAGFLSRYQPGAAAPPEVPFWLMIRRLQSDAGRVLYGGRDAGQPALTLPYSQNGLRFDFSAPFYDDPKAVEYQTLLEGGASAWSPWTKESWRDLSNLWEGAYRMRVRARNPHGQLSNEASYGFLVLPPWYRTWWAYLLYAAVTVGLASLLLKWRLYQLRERNRKLEQIVEERTVEIRLQRDQIQTQEEKTESLLLNILPASVASELRSTGSVQPMQFDDVTVCFTDFVGFTVSSETIEARDVVAQLDRYFTEFDGIIARYGLEKLKTIGDSYMFVSGLPQATGSHAVDAVLAALEILEKAKEIAARAGGMAWRLRIGLHSGPVVAGVVGVRKFAFDIWGDTVNLASRMESSGAPDRVNLSERTYSFVRDFIECEPRGAVRTKDGRELEMYFAQGMRLRDGEEASSEEFLPAYERQYLAAFDGPPRALPQDGVRDLLLPASYRRMVQPS